MYLELALIKQVDQHMPIECMKHMGKTTKRQNLRNSKYQKGRRVIFFALVGGLKTANSFKGIHYQKVFAKHFGNNYFAEQLFCRAPRGAWF